MTLYEVLGVSPRATQEEIKSAYRSKAKVMHPDHGGNADHFRILNDAYEVLSNPSKRDVYDRGGQVGPKPILIEDIIRQFVQRVAGKVGQAVSDQMSAEQVGAACYAAVISAINAPLPVQSFNEDGNPDVEMLTLMQLLNENCDLLAENNRNARIANGIHVAEDVAGERRFRKKKAKR